MDTRKWVGLRNYVRLFQDDIFLRSIYNTFVYAVFSVFPLMVLGLMTALAVNRQTKALYLARALFVFPYITSMVAVSMIWLCIFDPTTGIFNKLLELVHLPAQRWLFDEHLAMPCLIGVNIWKNLGYVMLLFLAGLQSIPGELYEAGRVDGAGDIRMVFAITLPALKPVSFFIFTTICVEAFKSFDQVQIMTNGGPLNTTTTMVPSDLSASLYRIPDGLCIGPVRLFADRHSGHYAVKLPVRHVPRPGPLGKEERLCALLSSAPVPAVPRRWPSGWFPGQ